MRHYGVADPGDYEVTKTDIEQLQKSNTQLNRAITKLKRKVKK
jgi:cell division protein FtsB